MDKQEFRVMSIYVLLICILSLVIALFAPPLASQAVLFMVASGGLTLLGIYALFRRDE
jgi:hypothetical protein